MKRILAITMLALFILMPVLCLAKTTNIIEGGKGIGGVQLGRPMEQIEKYLGPGKPINNVLRDYPEKGLALMVKKGIIEGIMIYSPNYRTKENIRVGSPVKSLEKVYGKYMLTDSGAMTYSELGLAFNEKDYKINRILIVKASPDVLLGDRMVIPGSRFGSIKIGMEMSDVEKHWGKPDRVENSKVQNVIISVYEKKGVRILSDSGIVGGAQIVSYKYRTPEGIGVDSTREQVIKTYGKRFKAVGDSISYGALGIGFYFNKGKVLEILVNPKNQ